MADIIVGVTSIKPTTEAPPSTSDPYLAICGKGPSELTDGQTVEIRCPMFAEAHRYVAILKEDVTDYLTICEVEIYGY